MTEMTQNPIACSLDASAAAQQRASWGDLRPMLVRKERTQDGVRLWFEAEAAAPVTAVAQKEADCCNFLSFHLEHEAGTIRLDISSQHRDGVAVAQLLADQVEHERPGC